jgi:hypothetical protein
MPAVLAACAASTTNPSPRTAPDPVASASLFDAVKAQDASKVEQLLSGNPNLGRAKRADGISVLLLALFARQGEEGFVRPQENKMLASIVARHPALTPFEAAAVGDRAAVSAALAADPQFARSYHAPPIGWTALHFAGFGGQVEASELLIAHGAEVNAIAQTKFRNSPLQAALLTGQVEVARMLVAKGADVNFKQAEGITALHEAAQLGSEELVQLLVGAGADVNAKGGDGRTPLDLAIKANKLAVADLLRRHGGQPGAGG